MRTTTTTTPPPPKVFAGRLNARGTRTRLPRRAGGAWPARRRCETLERRRRAARAPPSCHEPLYRCSARVWRRRWQQGPRGVQPHPRPPRELEARLAPSLSSSAQHTTSSTHNHPSSPTPRAGPTRDPPPALPPQKTHCALCILVFSQQHARCAGGCSDRGPSTDRRFASRGRGEYRLILLQKTNKLHLPKKTHLSDLL